MHFENQRHGFLIEIDEDYHQNYTKTCEWSKILKHSQSLVQTFDLQSITVIRFNPDAWKVAGETRPFAFKNRLNELRNVIVNCLSAQDVRLAVFHMFYPCETVDDFVVQTEHSVVEEWFTELAKSA